jgi:hypothetical protein
MLLKLTPQPAFLGLECSRVLSNFLSDLQLFLDVSHFTLTPRLQVTKEPLDFVG